MKTINIDISVDCVGRDSPCLEVPIGLRSTSHFEGVHGVLDPTCTPLGDIIDAW